MQPRARLLLLLFAMNLINFIDRVNITIVAPVILKDLGWSNATLGKVMSATLFGYAAGQIPSGVLVDRFGGFVLLAVMCGAWSLATGLTPLVFGAFSMLLGMRFLLGFFESANNPGQTAINTRVFPPSQLARAQGFCFAGTQIGPLVASPVIGLLVTVYPWSYVFYACAVLGLVWVVAWVMLAPRDAIGGGRSSEAFTPARVAPRASALVLTRPVLVLSVAGFLWGYAMWLFVSWFPTYLFDARHLSMKELGWVNAIPTLGGIASMIGGGFVSDVLVRRGVAEGTARRVLVGGGLLGSAACIVAAVLVPTATLSVAAFTLNGFIQGLAVGPFYSIPAVLAPRAAGTIAATLNFCMAVGGVVSPYVAGALRDRTGDWVLPFLTAGGCDVAAGLIVLALARVERLPGAGAD